MKKFFSVALSIVFIVQSTITSCANAVQFKDVKNHWAKESIEKTVSLGLMSGYKDQTFGTKKNVTREELASIVLRLAGDPEVSTQKSFADISGRWSENAIKKSVALELIDPLSPNHFGPAQAATRQDVAYAVYKILLKNEIRFSSETSGLKDIASSPYKEAIEKVVASKVMSGYPDKNFAPNKNITRAELASILVRVSETIHPIPANAATSSATTAISDSAVAKSAPPESTVTLTIETSTGTKKAIGTFNRDLAYKTLELVNEERAKKNLSPLSWSSELEPITDIRAAEISKYFEHDRPNGTHWYDLYPAKENACRAENLAAYHSSPEEVVGAWMRSPGHRANILDPTYNKMSVSLFVEKEATNNGMYWAQHFRD